MMRDPHEYISLHINSKSPEEIMAEIDKQKDVIESIKTKMEHPDYAEKTKWCPSDETIISWHRYVLSRAKDELKRAGGTYNATVADLKYHAFCGCIEYINKIMFTIGSFERGYKMRIIDVKGEIPTFRTAFLRAEDDFKDTSRMENLPVTRKELFNGLRLLYLGEWRSWYDLRRYGMYLIGGTKWRLEIQFSNGYKPFISRGDYVYPYNFKEFEKLIGIGLKNEYDYWWRSPKYEHRIVW